MAFGYASQGSGGMSYCNQTPFPPREGWGLGARLQGVVNGLYDQGEFEAMKTPIGRRALRCDKDQFCAKMTVST